MLLGILLYKMVNDCMVLLFRVNHSVKQFSCHLGMHNTQPNINTVNTQHYSTPIVFTAQCCCKILSNE